MSQTKGITRIADVYAKFVGRLAIISGVAAAIMMLYTTADVFARYTFNNPLPAAFEYSIMLLVYITFFAVAWVQARGGHLRLGYLWDKSGPRGRALIDLVSVIIALFLYGIVTWQGWEWAIQSWVTMESTMGTYDVSLFPSRIALAIGVTLLAVQYIIDLVKCINVFITTREKGAK